LGKTGDSYKIYFENFKGKRGKGFYKMGSYGEDGFS
jgi:hypothetical protein